MDNTQIDRTAVGRVNSFFIEKFNWIVREQLVSDYGIDMQLEIIDNGNVTGVLIALQIKGGNSHCRTDKDNNFIYRGELRHLEYWNQHSLPVMLIWYNKSDENLYWQRVSIKSPNINILKKGWTLKIPRTNVLSADIKDRIIDECFDLNHYEIIQEEDVSISQAQRYTLKVVTHEEKKFIIKKIIKNLHNNYINSHKKINSLTIFYYKNISQVDNGFAFCETQWNNQQYDYRLDTIEPNDRIDDINIKWDDESDFFNDSLINNNKYIPKSEYIKICDKSMFFLENLVKKIDMQNIEETEKILQFFKIQIENEVHSVLNENFKVPTDITLLKRIKISGVNWLQNIKVIGLDKNRSIDNKQSLLKFYIEKIQKDINEYKQYKEILKR